MLLFLTEDGFLAKFAPVGQHGFAQCAFRLWVGGCFGLTTQFANPCLYSKDENDNQLHSTATTTSEPKKPRKLSFFTFDSGHFRPRCRVRL